MSSRAPINVRPQFFAMGSATVPERGCGVGSSDQPQITAFPTPFSSHLRSGGPAAPPPHLLAWGRGAAPAPRLGSVPPRRPPTPPFPPPFFPRLGGGGRQTAGNSLAWGARPSRSAAVVSVPPTSRRSPLFPLP